MTPVQERLDATVRGRVQGVGFRYMVLEEAHRLGLAGWVANEPDGSVRCVAEGTREWPPEIDMSDEIRTLVTERWSEYGIPTDPSAHDRPMRHSSRRLSRR